ncbi:MAG: hypothetical protein ACYTHM_22495, partial [Planctomycetota bacterium]
MNIKIKIVAIMVSTFVLLTLSLIIYEMWVRHSAIDVVYDTMVDFQSTAKKMIREKRHEDNLEDVVARRNGFKSWEEFKQYIKHVMDSPERQIVHFMYLFYTER